MMRIDKYLAEMGQGTRSEIKKLIRSGRVMVDGETVKKPELKIDETTQKVSLEGKQIGYAKKEYYMLYKPDVYKRQSRHFAGWMEEKNSIMCLWIHRTTICWKKRCLLILQNQTCWKRMH